MLKSIFNEEIRKDVLNRINSLQPESKAQWGKMTVAQMVKHCRLCDEYYFGNVPVSRSFLGRIVGRHAIGAILKNEESVMGRNAPTGRQFKVSDTNLNFPAERENWKQVVTRYSTYSQDSFVHWFFGKLSQQQLGELIYKHCDHHLRQFGV
ncbi:MAG: DUF1569 domain-containing protein [Chitinophaga sp.]|uniref:DUF1569 domain-containing protein n=1 Tax=Chitinophaga sp. TaxID=1869181 RepID=UPI001B287B3C|nr:DUF1569 domain-containing protein [Chitinophaga sp.]MBO9728660.1 DUF1569 domain-containing protein [Chitinophaga sp.]